jgi:hypothetical protein
MDIAGVSSSVAAAGQDLIRVVAASTGTFYGPAMTAGRIYTVSTNQPAADVAVGSA